MERQGCTGEEPQPDTDPDIGAPRRAGQGPGTREGRQAGAPQVRAEGVARGIGGADTDGAAGVSEGPRGRRPREAWSKSPLRGQAPEGSSYVWRYNLRSGEREGEGCMSGRGKGSRQEGAII